MLCVGLAAGVAGIASLGASPADSAGPGTPGDCHGGAVTVASADGQSATYHTVDGTIQSVCIKPASHSDDQAVASNFDSAGHEGPLLNGVYDHGCYRVSGVGTATATVKRIGEDGDCRDIGHVDFLIAPATPTPSPTATATATDTPAPPAAPTDTPTTAPTNSPTPTDTPTPTPTPTQTPTPTATTPSQPVGPQNVVVPPPATPTAAPSPTSTPKPTPTHTPPAPPVPPLPPATGPVATESPVPLDVVLGEVSTPTPTSTPSPTPSPSPRPSPAPTATPSPLTLAPPGSGFTRVVLPAGSGYAFGPGVIGAAAVDVSWSGGHLIAGPSARFTQPVDASSPDRAGTVPATGFDLSDIQPGPGTAFFVRVHGASGDSFYEVWIPLGEQTSDAQGPLTFDFKVVTPPQASPAGPLPSVLNDINLAGDIFSGGASVATTNLLATIAVVLLLLAGGSVFNEALQDTLAGWRVTSIRLPGAVGSPVHRVQTWLSAIGAAWAALIPGRTFMDKALAPAALLFGTGLIYSLLDPGFGLNQTTLTLFISLVISQGVLALAYEGGKAWLYRRHLGVSAGVRLFPASMLIALISVAISRLGDLHPGIVVGFIAAAVLFEREGFSEEERGKSSARIAAITLGISIGAWLLAIPLHHLYDSTPNLWTALPEAIATSTFVVCLEGLLFSLMPLQFMDGWGIWKWSRIAWLALFIPTVLLFMQILFNAEQSYFDFVTSHRSISGIALIVAYLACTWGTWAYLRWRAEKGQDESGLQPANESAQ